MICFITKIFLCLKLFVDIKIRKKQKAKDKYHNCGGKEKAPNIILKIKML